VKPWSDRCESTGYQIPTSKQCEALEHFRHNYKKQNDQSREKPLDQVHSQLPLFGHIRFEIRNRDWRWSVDNQGDRKKTLKACELIVAQDNGQFRLEFCRDSDHFKVIT
jgi:hypothetical protein